MIERYIDGKYGWIPSGNWIADAKELANMNQFRGCV